MYKVIKLLGRLSPEMEVHFVSGGKSAKDEIYFTEQLKVKEKASLWKWADFTPWA